MNVSLTPSGSTFTGTGSHTITVTSTDVVGYSLYIYGANGTSMTSGSNSIPASSNGTLAPLATNTWGYNIDGSNNYLGLTSNPTLLKTATGPYESGDTTTVKYGILTDITAPEGTYNALVTFTAVALNQ